MQILDKIVIIALALCVLKLHKDLDELYGYVERLAVIVNHHVDHISSDRNVFMKLWKAHDALALSLSKVADDVIKLRNDVDNNTTGDCEEADSCSYYPSGCADCPAVLIVSNARECFDMVVQDAPTSYTGGFKSEEPK